MVESVEFVANWIFTYLFFIILWYYLFIKLRPTKTNQLIERWFTIKPNQSWENSILIAEGEKNKKLLTVGQEYFTVSAHMECNWKSHKELSSQLKNKIALYHLY